MTSQYQRHGQILLGSFLFHLGGPCLTSSAEFYFNKNIFMFESNSLITQA